MKRTVLLVCLFCAGAASALVLPTTKPVSIYFERSGWFLCADLKNATVVRRSWFDTKACFWFVTLAQEGAVSLSLKPHDQYLAVQAKHLVLVSHPLSWQLRYRSAATTGFDAAFTLSNASSYLSAGPLPAHFSFAPTAAVQITPTMLQQGVSDQADLLLHFGTPPVR